MVIRDGRITEVDLIADPERLAALEPSCSTTEFFARCGA
jgi:hypothetical protein